LDNFQYLRFALAFILVMGLIGLAAYAARRFGLAPRIGTVRGKRLGIVEITALDAKTRLVLIRRDDVEHLLLLGPGQGLLIESLAGPAARPLSPASRPGEEKAE
jgi:flagellar protein FliO/FliZ